MIDWLIDHLDIVDVEGVLLVLAGEDHEHRLGTGPSQVDELHCKVACADASHDCSYDICVW